MDGRDGGRRRSIPRQEERESHRPSQSTGCACRRSGVSPRALALDGFVQIPLSAAVVPAGSSHRELWIGLGAISFDLLLGIVATSLLRRRVGERPWRLVHWFTNVSWPIAVAHGRLSRSPEAKPTRGPAHTRGLFGSGALGYGSRVSEIINRSRC